MSLPDFIAVVDDTEGTRFALRRTLEGAGFSVQEGKCGADALRLAALGPSLIILDVHMPDLMGTEVSRRLKADPRTRSIPILHLSASYTAELDRAAGLESGADAYLTEPVEPQLLFATIHALLRARAAEQVAETALKSQDAFLTGTSHDIRNLLQAMRMTLDLQLRRMQDRHVDQEALTRALERSIADVGRTTRLVEDLLEGAQLQAGKMVLHREELDLIEAVRDVVERLRPQAAAAGSKLELESTDSIRGRFDRLRLNQMIANLLSNAFKYGAGKPIVVRVHAEPGTAVIEVADQGPGVPASQLERVFDRFERGGAEDRPGSYGLGLWIVRELARLHGGSATVTSEVGRGATFRIMLPLAASASA